MINLRSPIFNIRCSIFHIPHSTYSIFVHSHPALHISSPYATLPYVLITYFLYEEEQHLLVVGRDCRGHSRHLVFPITAGGAGYGGSWNARRRGGSRGTGG